MSICFTSLNSGSNGNCYYIGNEKEAVLIDAGLSYKETLKRMNGLGIDIRKVKGIFISHEHIDHIKGVELISDRFNIPVYANRKTWEASKLLVRPQHKINIRPFESITLETLSIIGFTKNHDAIDPLSFTITDGTHTVGVFTDIGSVCENVITHFKKCDAAFLEANYDEEMLENGPYPFHLRKRISGENGHLSNVQALELFRQHKSENLSHLFLSHLSRENNSPALVAQLFLSEAGNTNIAVASRYEAMPLQYLTKAENKKAAPFETMQLGLFN